jgi:prepilin-type N-terminal cleavage/methylation domain-containing protein
MRSNTRGFTLVEIAIVLVIVGLLIGGVLKGQEMITNAKVKRIESDNAGISAAMFSYQDRYQELPGDDLDASTRFDSLGGDTNFDGDGNNLIGLNAAVTNANGWASGATDPAAAPENLLFWAHLRAAGLVAGGATDIRAPSNAYGGKIGIQANPYDFGGHGILFSELNGNIVKILEGRLDDGAPNTGRVRGLPATVDVVGVDPAAFPPFESYADDNVYNIGFRL